MNTQGGPLEFDYDIKLQNFEAKLKTIETKLNGLGSNAVKQSTMVDKAWGNVMAAAGAYVSFQALTGFVSKIVEVRGEFQKLEAVLTNSFGDASKSKQALSMLTDFASKTPFQVTDLTQSFVKLVNQGFEPTIDDMTSLGDLASSTGKGFDQLTEAIIDAQTMEFERLKEFGIRASKEGDKVTFTFKNQKTTVDATADSIRQYVLSLGKMEGVSGSMDAISKTLVGQISNMKDAWEQLLNTMGTQTEGVFATVISGISKLLIMLNKMFTTNEERRLQMITQNAGFDFEIAKKEMEAMAAQKVASGMNEKEAFKQALDEKKKDIEAKIKEYQAEIDKWNIELDNWSWVDEKDRTKSDRKQIEQLQQNISMNTDLVDILKKEFEAFQALDNIKKGSGPAIGSGAAQAEADKALKAFEKTLAEQKKAYQQYEDAKVVYGIDKAEEMYPQLLESYKAFLMQLREKYHDNPAFAGVIATELAPLFKEDQLEQLPRIQDFYEKNRKVNRDITKEMQYQYERSRKTYLELQKQKGLWDQVSDYLKNPQTWDQAAMGLGKLADAFSGINDSVSQTLANYSRMASDAASLAEGISTKNSTQTFTSAISLMVTFFESFNRQVENTRGAYESLNELIATQIEMLGNFTGTEKLEKTVQLLSDIKQQAEGLIFKGDKYVTPGSNWADAAGITDFYDPDLIEKSTIAANNLKDAMAFIKDRFPNLVDNYDRAIDAYETLISLRDEYDNLLSEFYADIIGSTFQSISDTIRDGFEDGLTSVQDFSDKTSNIIRKALMESFQTQFLDAQIQKWFLSFGNAAQDGLTQQETSQAKTDLETLIANSATAFEAYKKMMEELGVWNTGTEQSQSALAGAIKGITEDTANVVAGQMNAIRIIGIRQAELADSSNSHLARIAQNTENNWHLPTIASELRAIKSALSSNTSLIHSRASGR